MVQVGALIAPPPPVDVPPRAVCTLAMVDWSAPKDWRSDTMALIWSLVRFAACAFRAPTPKRRTVAKVTLLQKRIILNIVS
jgi:hypothetical protein